MIETYQIVDVLGEVRGQSLGLQDPEDLVAGHEPNLGDAVAVPQDDANLRRGQTLLGELEDLLLDVIRGQLEPGGNGAAEGQSRLGDTLARCVHTTHDDRFFNLRVKYKT